MTKQEALKYSIFYTALIALGFFIAFKVWWTPGSTRFLGLVAFAFVFFGFLFLSFCITRLLMPAKSNFRFSSLSNPVHYQSFKKEVGTVAARKISFISASLFIFLCGIAIYFFITQINRYEYHQLKDYGQHQWVRINNIRKKGKGPQYAVFDYYLNGQKYSNDLYQNSFSIGDSAEIIFSTQNPDILKWAKDFNPDEE